MRQKVALNEICPLYLLLQSCILVVLSAQNTYYILLYMSIDQQQEKRGGGSEVKAFTRGPSHYILLYEALCLGERKRKGKKKSESKAVVVMGILRKSLSIQNTRFAHHLQLLLLLGYRSRPPPLFLSPARLPRAPEHCKAHQRQWQYKVHTSSTVHHIIVISSCISNVRRTA